MTDSIELISIGTDKDGIEVFAPAHSPKPQITEPTQGDNNAFKAGFRVALSLSGLFGLGA